MPMRLFKQELQKQLLLVLNILWHRAIVKAEPEAGAQVEVLMKVGVGVQDGCGMLIDLMIGRY